MTEKNTNPNLKYSEFLKHIASLIVTQDELNTLECLVAGDGFYYSEWICNTMSGRTDPFSKKLRATIKKKIEAKVGKGTATTFTGLFIGTYDKKENKQYRINWLLKLAALYESKGN